jgi:hypothetical protein
LLKILSRPTIRAIAAIAFVAGLVVLAAWPVTTRYGVNYRWSSKRIPLFEKAVNFASRDLQLRRVAQEVSAEIGAGTAPPEQKAVKLFDWVVRNVRRTPPGFPVVDDHILHILIRGYGAPDQRAEALAVLASYNRLPATAAVLMPPEGGPKLTLALVRVDTRLAVFDVMHEVAFRRRTGELADLNDLVTEPSLVTERTRGVSINGVPYERYVPALRALRPEFSRMERQKVWPRIRYEVGRWVRVGGDGK